MHYDDKITDKSYNDYLEIHWSMIAANVIY